MFLRFLIFSLLPTFCWAQSVQITEIAPHTLNYEPEWFEFKVEDFELADVETWQLSNGTQTPKKIIDHLEKLHSGDDDNYFYFLPSPLGLPNDGGHLQILDNSGNILNELEYQKAKSSSTKSYEQREVWNWSDTLQSLLPQIIRDSSAAGYQHSRGQENHPLPTHPSQFTAIINEFSPDNSDTDFIEIYIKDGPEKINLQYAQIKHNGTVLWHFEQPFFTAPGDYLVFKIGTPDVGKAGENLFHTNAKSGLSAGSGTIELVAMAQTGLEQRIDAVCWQNKTLSQTEQSRVNKFIEAGDWNGPCLEIKDLVHNESLARPTNGPDENTQADWLRHFNGSIGNTNEPQNMPPVASITVQGSGKIIGNVPFFINLSAENSLDPDGQQDLKLYEWRLNGDLISEIENPAGFYIKDVGEFKLELTVTDQSGAQARAAETIIGTQKGGGNSNNGSQKAKAAAVEQLLKQTFSNPKTSRNDNFDDFLTPYLTRTDWTAIIMAEPLGHPLYPPYENLEESPPKPSLYTQNWQRQINLPTPVRNRVKKNIGVLFSWRESPWPGLAKEWTAVVEHDQTFGYFGGVYLGF